jgi:CBS domain-containing protein
MRASDIMSSPVVVVTPDTTVKDAAILFAANGFTALPVLDDTGRLIGVVTEAELVRDQFPCDARNLRARAENDVDTTETARVPAGTVGQVMTTPAVSMATGTDVVDLVAAMTADHVRTMPIMAGSRLVGIVTRRDLLRVLARDDVVIATDVRHQLANYGGSARWTVGVLNGTVTVTDQFDDATDRHVAVVLAEAVPGVIDVHVTGGAITR